MKVVYKTTKKKKIRKKSVITKITVTPCWGFANNGTPWRLSYVDNKWSPGRGEALFAFSVQPYVMSLITYLPSFINYFPHAWFYGDGGIDWAKNKKT